MNNFKLGRGYTNSIRRTYTINVGEINPNEINDTINRIRDMFRDRGRTEIRHEYYRRIINSNENNTI
jgi:hypothetical protein